MTWLLFLQIILLFIILGTLYLIGYSIKQELDLSIAKKATKEAQLDLSKNLSALNTALTAAKSYSDDYEEID